MDVNKTTLLEHLRRHGIGQTALDYAFRVLRRFVDFQILRVETVESGSPLPSAAGGPYVTSEVTTGEYHTGTAGLEGEHVRRQAFARGDRCFANVLDGQIVGYTFYGSQPTPVRPGLTFHFPEGMLYMYASYTHPAHRGMRLALARSNARRLVDASRGPPARVIWYVAVDNSASRASAQPAGPSLLGYVGYVGLGNRLACFASPGCRRECIELVADRTDWSPGP